MTNPTPERRAIADVIAWAAEPAAGSGDYYAGHDAAREAVADMLADAGPRTFTGSELADLPIGALLLDPATGAVFRKRYAYQPTFLGRDVPDAFGRMFAAHAGHGLGWGSTGDADDADLGTELVLVWQPRADRLAPAVDPEHHDERYSPELIADDEARA